MCLYMCLVNTNSCKVYFLSRLTAKNNPSEVHSVVAMAVRHQVHKAPHLLDHGRTVSRAQEFQNHRGTRTTTCVVVLATITVVTEHIATMLSIATAHRIDCQEVAAEDGTARIDQSHQMMHQMQVTTTLELNNAIN